MVQALARTGEWIYGRRADWEDADLYLLGIGWEGGVSFRRGTALAPRLIQAVSTQMDYYSPDREALEKARIYLEHLPLPETLPPDTTDELYETAVLQPLTLWLREVLRTGKPFGVLGGDHSVAIGVHRLLSEEKLGYALLYIDAHADLRPSYDGLTYSHATPLYHALQTGGISRVVAVGVRDWDRSEVEYARSCYPRLQMYEMRRLTRMLYLGRSWSEIISEIISLLPEKVYISVDVDALEVGYVPHTGTPVPGGLTYEQLGFLLDSIGRSGRKVIAFDLCETGGAELDAIVSAHLLYRLCGLLVCEST